jgi:hypothetical protein
MIDPRRAGAPEQGRSDSRPSTQPGIVPSHTHAGQPLGITSSPAGYRMITSVDIENFRPFKKAKLSDLARINIVVGDNSSGKTAFLEALFLASASNPQIPITLRQWRGLETAQVTTTTDLYDALWNNLFNDFDRSTNIDIQLRGSESDSRSLSMYFKKETEVTLPLKSNGGGGGEIKSSGIYQPFVFHWKSPNGPEVMKLF